MVFIALPINHLRDKYEERNVKTQEMSLGEKSFAEMYGQNE